MREFDWILVFVAVVYLAAWGFLAVSGGLREEADL